MSATNTFSGVCILICTLVVLIFVSLALGGGTWIEGIDNEGDFFTRASYTYKDIALISDGRLLSMGMWRYFTEPGVSAPLPFRGQCSPVCKIRSKSPCIIFFRNVSSKKTFFGAFRGQAPFNIADLKNA